MDEMMLLSEVAEALGVSRQAVHLRVKSGDMPSVVMRSKRVGKDVLHVRRADVEAAIEAGVGSDYARVRAQDARQRKIAVRRTRVAELHGRGETLAAIARDIGCTAGTVRRDLDALAAGA